MIDIGEPGAVLGFGALAYCVAMFGWNASARENEPGMQRITIAFGIAFALLALNGLFQDQ